MSVSERAEQADVSSLILPDRIHGSLYYDQALFEQELRQIWRKACSHNEQVLTEVSPDHWVACQVRTGVAATSSN